MIDTVTINGQPMDPCLVLAQVTVLHGRGGFGESGQPSSATVVIEHPVGTMPTWQGGDTLILSSADDTMPWTPLNLSGCVLALEAADVAAGPVTTWPDRSPAGNDVVVSAGDPIASAGFVTCTSVNVLATSDPIPVIGDAPRHLFVRMLSRDVGGSFLGYGTAAEGCLFDLWNFNPGALVWHGYGSGMDTTGGAPEFTSDEWHVAEVSYDGSVVSVSVDGGTPTVATLPTALLTPSSVMRFGLGGFSEASDFDMAACYLFDRVLTGEERTQVLGYLSGATAASGGGPRMFSGRIISRSLGHVDDADGTRWGQFTVTAAGALAALGVRKIGDEPWPQETGTERATRILTAAGTPWEVDGTVDITVLARDVDAQPALGLLDQLASDTAAAVFDTPTGEVVYQSLAGRSRPVVPFMWSDFDAALTWDGFDAALTWDGASPSIGDWPSPTSEFPVVLPCAAVQWEPEWHSSESTVINHVRIGYGDANPQPTVELEDATSIGQHGRRYVYLGTALALVADATASASRILTTQAVERWEIGDVTVALDLLDPATYADALGLVCGDHVTLRGLPQPAPATDWTGICEGWTFTQWGTGGVLQEQLVLALSDPLLSLAVMTWDDYPSLYEWQDHPGHITWDDLETVAILEETA